jgi:hypothetical protein
MKYKDPKTGAKAKVFGTILFVYGTGDPQDKIQDAKAWPIYHKGAIGHYGSFQQAKFLYNAVDWNCITKIAAHSLGADVALWLKVMGVYVEMDLYGPFRAFLWYPKKLKKDIRIFIYGWDPIARFLIPGYHHVVKPTYIKGKGFHPMTDHFRYQDLTPYVDYILEEL